MADPQLMFSGLGDVEVAETAPAPAQVEQQRGFFGRLVDGLSKSSKALTGQIQQIAFDPDDEEAWERLEEALLLADCGVPATVEIIGRLERRAAAGGLEPGADLAPALAEEIADLMSGAEERIDVSHAPTVILMVGVNGTGKTTTAGKLCARFAAEGRRCVLAAADTFRAAAIDQLDHWAKASGAQLIRQAEGSDPAAVVFDAVQAAKARGAGTLVVDTAGRLHNKQNLMDELAKIRRVIAREAPDAHCTTLLVVDATTGQNAVVQARFFRETASVDGIALTKLDGNAKGGVAVAVAHETRVPILLAGLGERIEDLVDFDAEAFVDALLPNE